MNLNHIEKIYNNLQTPPIYGQIEGVCRVTGKESKGLYFQEWVRKTFTDFPYLKQGSIISNEALFTFDEKSTILQAKVKKERPQRFRTYSHILCGDEWYAVTKADKVLMWDLIINHNPECVCIAESGQKHIFFKVRQGWWQFEERQIQPNVEELIYINSMMNELYTGGFTQVEIQTGKYQDHRILKFGVHPWRILENSLKKHRYSNLFDFAAFFMQKQDVAIQEIVIPSNQNNKPNQLSLF